MSAVARQLSFDFCHPAGHFDQLHEAAHGTVLLWELANGNRWHKLQPGDPRIPALLAAQLGQTDRYFTVNEFLGWRLVRLLKSLRACYVDLDNFTDLDAALDALASARMPAPSFVIMSGRGLHLYWLLTPTLAQALPVWQHVQNALVAALAPVGADTVVRDCTRVLRLAGTINSKNGAEVRGLVLTGTQWTLHELADEVLGARPKRTAKVRDLGAAKARRGERARTGSIFDRWHLVYRDLIQIAEWHHRIPVGYRDQWLFLSTVALSWFASPASLEHEIQANARKWTPGLELEAQTTMQTVIDRAVKAVAGETIIFQGEEVDPRYRFKRETLYQWMAPIIPAGLLPSLRAIIPDALRQEHKRGTDKAHEAKRDRVAEGRYKKAHASEDVRESARLMRTAGQSYRSIAAELGVSEGTIRNWCKGA